MTAELQPRELSAILESLGRSIARKSQQGEAATAPEPKPPAQQTTPTAQLILFPQWTDDRRAAAHAIFRSALFPALNNKHPRRYFEQEQLCSVEGVDVIFTGKQFDQSDLDVYLELLNIARETPFGVECTFTVYGLLKALGHATGNKDHKWLHSVLIRLCTGTVDMTDHEIRYFGHLVDGGIKDEITKHYTISINPRFARLFTAGLWATIDRGQRRALGRNQTAKALHAYYSTHAAPGPHSFEKLAALIGLTNSNTRQRRADLIRAHDHLKAKGCLDSYEVKEDSIVPHVHQTHGQLRHIAKKARPRRKD